MCELFTNSSTGAVGWAIIQYCNGIEDARQSIVDMQIQKFDHFVYIEALDDRRCIPPRQPLQEILSKCVWSNCKTSPDNSKHLLEDKDAATTNRHTCFSMIAIDTRTLFFFLKLYNYPNRMNEAVMRATGLMYITKRIVVMQ